MRWTVYVDIDAYYVSCELRDRPELVGQPVIVGPDPRLGPTRGVVLSASYEARRFGVRSALPVGRALALCPAAVWIPPDFEKYERLSRAVRDHLARGGGRVLPLSIDEAALELDLPDAASAEVAARAIQAGLRDALQLPSSIGVAAHRVIAKIASDRAKPGGVVVVAPGTEAEFLAPLPARSIPGVGPKTAERLAHVGVTTISDLLRVPSADLRRAVGGFAEELRELARGRPREQSERAADHRRSAAETFLEDVAALGPLEEALGGLARRLADALDADHVAFGTVAVTVRWADFAQSQHQRRLPHRVRDAATLERVAGQLLERLWSEEARGRHRAVRTLSVAAGALSDAPSRARPLESFERPEAGTVISPGRPRSPAGE